MQILKIILFIVLLIFVVIFVFQNQWIIQEKFSINYFIYNTPEIYLWIILLIQAGTGKMWKVPWAGNWAEKQASK